MENWHGPITDPDVNLRFQESARRLTPHVHSAIRIHVCCDWRNGTVGMLNGKPCMSPDMHEAMLPARITPEDN